MQASIPLLLNDTIYYHICNVCNTNPVQSWVMGTILREQPVYNGALRAHKHAGKVVYNTFVPRLVLLLISTVPEGFAVPSLIKL